MRYSFAIAAWLSLLTTASAALTADWPLQGNATARVGANGTLNGTPGTADGPGGILGSSVDLDGTDDYVSVGTADFFDFTTGTAFSVACWFNADSLSGPIVGRAANANRYIDILSSTQIRVYTSAGAIDFTVPTMSTGTWYHLLVTRDTGNSVKVYLNGTQSSTGAQNGGGSFTFDSIGRRNTTYCNCKIAGVRVYNSDESAAISSIMADVTATFAYAQSASSTSDLTTYTFSSQNLGAAASDRYVIVGIHSRDSGAHAFTGVTVQGITATYVVQASNNASGGSLTGLYIVAVPTGTTGDVVVTLDNAAVGCGISLWRATGLASATPVDSDSSTASNPTATINTEDGFAIGVANDVGLDTFSWTNLTEDYDAQIEGNSTFSSASATTTAGSLAITATPSSSGNAVGVFATWAQGSSGVVDPLSTSIPGVSRDPLTGTIPGL